MRFITANCSHEHDDDDEMMTHIMDFLLKLIINGNLRMIYRLDFLRITDKTMLTQLSKRYLIYQNNLVRG